MYGYGFRLQCRYSAHIQSTNVHICIDTIHCKIQKYFYTKKNNNVSTLKCHFLEEKKKVQVFFVQQIYMLLYRHTCHTCTCVTHTSVPS